MTSDLIQLKDITKTYKIGEGEFQALKGVNVTIKQGELIAIAGASGSGKTTIMHIMGLIDRPTTGEYLLDGIPTSTFGSDQLAELRNIKIGFVFQFFFLLPRLTALQNVLLPLYYRHGVTEEEQHHFKEAALKVLARVGMEKFIHHRPIQLSGGQQQRIAIARALVGKPPLILADEPTGSLDVKTSKEVLDFLIEINENEKTTIVIITHDPEVAARCQRIIQVSDGLIRSQG